MVRLAEYSRDCLMDLRRDTGISYDERMQGTLQLFRTQKQVDGAYKDIKVLKADGVPFEVLDADGCIARRTGSGRAPRRDRGRACVCRAMRLAIASSSPTACRIWRSRPG